MIDLGDPEYHPPLKLRDELLGAHTEGGPGPPYGSYSLKIISSRFEDCPLILLVRDEGGSSRSYQYVLYRLVRSGRLQELWSHASDGQGSSTAGCYQLSTLDFSALASGARNEIVVSTTAQCRRVWPEAGVTKDDLLPKYTSTLYWWNQAQGRFLEVK